MTPDQWIALSASIAGFAAAIATLLTVKEMAKQRQTTYRPQLVVQSLRVLTLSGPGSRPTDWIGLSGASDSVETERLARSLREGKDVSAALLIHNIGLGAARDVQLVWSFHMIDAVSRFNSIATAKAAPTRMTIVADRLALHDCDEVAPKVFYPIEAQEHRLADFLAQSSPNGTAVPFTLPAVYRVVVPALVAISSEEADVYKPGYLPSLALRIDYTDIGGTKHRAEYTINAELRVLGDCPSNALQDQEGFTFGVNLIPRAAA